MTAHIGDHVHRPGSTMDLVVDQVAPQGSGSTWLNTRDPQGRHLYVLGDEVEQSTTTETLTDALWRTARGEPGEEAAVGLLIATRTWLRNPLFGLCVTVVLDAPAPAAWVDWEGLAEAVESGAIPCAPQDQRIALCAALIATRLPGMVAGLEPPVLRFVLDAVAHTAGWVGTGQPDAYVDGGLGDMVGRVAGRCAS